ncbi:MAG: TonB-dependent receptor [Chromatiales bacterium]|nr:MAG: TonB-dependent receptor [Chromatiales bacterium]
MGIGNYGGRLAVTTALLALSTASFAVTDEIIVTASKRASTIQDLPFSVNAQTELDIQRTGSSNLEDLSRNVAGLAIQNLGPGQSQVGIRGVSAGQIVRDQPGVKEQVGVYLDESVISLSLFTPDLDLFDLNRVETLRGPQGTLFGSGSVGGTIRYITNQPKLGEFEGLVEANVNSVTDGEIGGHGKGMVNVPVGDKAALRIVGYYTEYAGFIDALQEGGGVKEDVNSGDREGVRVAMRFEPTENIAITPRVIYQETNTDGFNRQEVFNLFANPFTTTRPAVTFSERQQFLLLDEAFEDETTIADLTLEVGMGSMDLTSITSYTDRSILVSRDASALTGSVSVDPLGFPEADILLPSNLLDTTDVKQWTQEVRLASNGDGRLQWLVGAFYSDTERDYAQRLPTPGYDAATDATLGAGESAGAYPPGLGYGPDSPYNSDLPYDLTQYAVFGEATYDITDQLSLTAGARYYDFEEERSFISGGVFSNLDNRFDKTDSDGVTPRVMVKYDVSDAVSVNAQASQGFRLGGVNDPLNVPLCTDEDEAIFGGFQSYDDETMWNYETGVKINSGGVTFNAAVFHTEISDLQVTLDAGSCSSRISFNVPDAHTTGVEFEISGEPVEGLEVSFAGSLLEAEFDSTVRDGNGDTIGGIEDGNRLASVPEIQLAAAATYSFPLNIGGGSSEGFVGASLQYIGDRYTQPSDQVAGAGDFVSDLPYGGAPGTDVTSVDLELDDYTIINLNAGIDFDVWSVLAYVTNVADENAELAFDRERGGRARLGTHTNQPRTVGLTTRFRF